MNTHNHFDQNIHKTSPVRLTLTQCHLLFECFTVFFLLLLLLAFFSIFSISHMFCPKSEFFLSNLKNLHLFFPLHLILIVVVCLPLSRLWHIQLWLFRTLLFFFMYGNENNTNRKEPTLLVKVVNVKKWIGVKEAFELEEISCVWIIPPLKASHRKQQTTAKVPNESNGRSSSNTEKNNKILTRHFWVCVFFFIYILPVHSTLHIFSFKIPLFEIQHFRSFRRASIYLWCLVCFDKTFERIDCVSFDFNAMLQWVRMYKNKIFIQVCVALCCHTPSSGQHLPIEFCWLIIELLSVIPGLAIFSHINSLKLQWQNEFFLLFFFSSFYFVLLIGKILDSIANPNALSTHKYYCGTRKSERKNMTVV